MKPGRPAPAAATFVQTARAVACSFFGVRRAVDLERDAQRLSPVHVVVGGVLGAAALLVAALVWLVRWVVGSGVAA